MERERARAGASFGLTEGAEATADELDDLVARIVAAVPHELRAPGPHAVDAPVELHGTHRIPTARDLLDLGAAALLAFASLRLSVIKRGGRYGLRVRDAESPARRHLSPTSGPPARRHPRPSSTGARAARLGGERVDREAVLREHRRAPAQGPPDPAPARVRDR